MFETVVGGSWKHVVAGAQLLEVPKALELGRVDDLRDMVEFENRSDRGKDKGQHVMNRPNQTQDSFFIWNNKNNSRAILGLTKIPTVMVLAVGDWNKRTAMMIEGGNAPGDAIGV